MENFALFSIFWSEQNIFKWNKMKRQWKVTFSYAQNSITQSVRYFEGKKCFVEWKHTQRQISFIVGVLVSARLIYRIHLGFVWHWTGIKTEPKSSDWESDKIDDNTNDVTNAESMFIFKLLQFGNKFNFHVCLVDLIFPDRMRSWIVCFHILTCSVGIILILWQLFSIYFNQMRSFLLLIK